MGSQIFMTILFHTYLGLNGCVFRNEWDKIILQYNPLLIFSSECGASIIWKGRS